MESLSIDIELRSIEWQLPEDVTGFDLLAVGFPVYSGDSPEFIQEFLERLPASEGRGAFLFCTKGAYAAGAVRLNLQRLAVRGYVPLAAGSVIMPGSDGLSMVSKDSWMARKALEKDYDHLKDADRLARRMASAVSDLRDGRPLDQLGQDFAARPGSGLSDRLWASLYRLSESWTRGKFHAGEPCKGCGLCARLCPVDSITMIDGRPQFTDRCVLCLRCLHACPSEAIQIGKLTVGKLRWKGPKGEFSPLGMRKNPERDPASA